MFQQEAVIQKIQDQLEHATRLSESGRAARHDEIRDTLHGRLDSTVTTLRFAEGVIAEIGAVISGGPPATQPGDQKQTVNRFGVAPLAEDAEQMARGILERLQILRQALV